MKDFTTYEQSLALIKLGFDEPCLGYWSNWGTQEPFLITCELGNEKKSCSIRRKNLLCKGLTYAQAFRWFRDNHSLRYKFEPSKENTVDIFIWHIVGWAYFTNIKEDDAESTCMNKLIEIVKANKS